MDSETEPVDRMESTLDALEPSEMNVRNVADDIRDLDCLVPIAVAEMDDLGVYPDHKEILFEVEADVVMDATRTGNPQYRLPEELRDLLDDRRAFVTEAALNPNGDGWGEPTFAVTVEVV